jgi:hypothetical protein
MSDRTRELAVGAGGGVGAFLVGYLATYLAVGSAVESSFVRQVIEAVGGDLPTWKVVGWVFFNAHAVSTRLPGLLGPESVNLLSSADAFPAALYVVPPLALLATGAAVGLVAADRADAGVGLAALVGVYLVAAGLGSVLVTVSAGDTSLGPATLPALALAGLGYPLVFGGVGAAAGSVLTDAGS